MSAHTTELNSTGGIVPNHIDSLHFYLTFLSPSFQPSLHHNHHFVFWKKIKKKYREIRQMKEKRERRKWGAFWLLNLTQHWAGVMVKGKTQLLSVSQMWLLQSPTLGFFIHFFLFLHIHLLFASSDLLKTPLPLRFSHTQFPALLLHLLCVRPWFLEWDLIEDSNTLPELRHERRGGERRGDERRGGEGRGEKNPLVY